MPDRSIRSTPGRRHLQEGPLLPRLIQLLLQQLPQCSDESLSHAAFGVSVFAGLHCFQPSDELLAALDAELVSRLASSAPGQPPAAALAGAVSNVFAVLNKNARLASVPLLEHAAAWLAGAPGAGEHRASGGGGARAMTPRQADVMLHAWAAFAFHPGAGAAARETLRAALGEVEAAHPQLFGDPACAVQRTVGSQLKVAHSVQVGPDLAHPQCFCAEAIAHSALLLVERRGFGCKAVS